MFEAASLQPDVIGRMIRFYVLMIPATFDHYMPVGAYLPRVRVVLHRIRGDRVGFILDMSLSPQLIHWSVFFLF